VQIFCNGERILKLHNKLGAALVAVALPLVANAKADQEIHDPVGISKVIHSIPTFRGDLGGSLIEGGMNVSAIRIHSITKEDVAEDPLHVAPGDVEIKVYTSDPQVEGCRILGSPSFLKRGKKYIPEDRTGWWLLKGNCNWPG
jgi:hypothetical protein